MRETVDRESHSYAWEKAIRSSAQSVELLSSSLEVSDVRCGGFLSDDPSTEWCHFLFPILSHVHFCIRKLSFTRAATLFSIELFRSSPFRSSLRHLITLCFCSAVLVICLNAFIHEVLSHKLFVSVKISFSYNSDFLDRPLLLFGDATLFDFILKLLNLCLPLNYVATVTHLNKPKCLFVY